MGRRAIARLCGRCTLTLVGLMVMTGWVQAQPTHEVYVWQRLWTASLQQAVEEQRAHFTRVHWLTGQLAANGRWVWTQVPDTVWQTGDVAVLRLDGRWLPDAPALLAAIKTRLHNLPAQTALEIDFDCPTRQLAAYRQLLQQLRAALPGRELTITVLPTWLSSDELPALLALADSPILQVHGVNAPDQPLFVAEQASRWLQAFSRATRGQSFRVALPTYGVRVFSDGEGWRVQAERPLGLGSATHQWRVDPAVLQHWLQTSRVPAALQAYVWFRLPTRDDQETWSATTLQAVIEGRYQPAQAELTLVPVGVQTWDIHLRNPAAVDVLMPPHLLIRGACQPGDGTAWYQQLSDSREGLRLSAMQSRLLKSGEHLTLGWIRCEDTPNATIVAAP